jgi:hypothetical protein
MEKLCKNWEKADSTWFRAPPKPAGPDRFRMQRGYPSSFEAK